MRGENPDDDGQPGVTGALRVLRAAAALSCAGALLAACSPAREDAAVPAGWVRVTEGRLSLAVPEDWIELPGGGHGWTVGWADGELATATYLVVGNPDLEARGADLGMDTFFAGTQLGTIPGFVTTKAGELEASDAVELKRLEFTYTDDSSADPLPGVFWAAADPDDRHTVGLELTGTSLPTELIDAIESTIRVLPEGDERP